MLCIIGLIVINIAKTKILRESYIIDVLDKVNYYSRVSENIESNFSNQSNQYNMEQSYIENILRNNIGKKVRVHTSFSDSVEWRDRVFTGIIEHAGRDNLIINDKENNKSYLILMIYLDFVEFDEEITYAK